MAARPRWLEVLGGPLAGRIAVLDPRTLYGLALACRAANDAVRGVRDELAAEHARLCADAALLLRSCRWVDLPQIARALWRLYAGRARPFAWNALLRRAAAGARLEGSRDPDAAAKLRTLGAFDASDLVYADGGPAAVAPAAATEPATGGDAWQERRALHAAGRAARAHAGRIAELPDLEGAVFCGRTPPRGGRYEVEGRPLEPGDAILLFDPVDPWFGLYLAFPARRAAGAPTSLVRIDTVPLLPEPAPLLEHYDAIRRRLRGDRGPPPESLSRVRLVVPGGYRVVDLAAPRGARAPDDP